MQKYITLTFYKFDLIIDAISHFMIIFIHIVHYELYL